MPMTVRIQSQYFAICKHSQAQTSRKAAADSQQFPGTTEQPADTRCGSCQRVKWHRCEQQYTDRRQHAAREQDDSTQREVRTKFG